jgi:DNA primase
MSRIKDLRMQLSEEDIKNILAKYGVFTHTETDNALIFPTACHNHEGGSPKLYYYKEDKIFRCYTECGSMFDIFDLLTKITKLRGEEISLTDAIRYTGVEQNEDVDPGILADLEYLKRLSAISRAKEGSSEIRILDNKIINSFRYNEIGLKPWLEEGISENALHRFNIKYDSTVNAIIIPNLDHNGNLIGVRGRFLNKDAPAKYMPIRYNSEILSHPTGKFLYGYYENKHLIREKGIAILFEGEKSVLKMETLYPQANIALATAGKKITLDQLNSLLKLNLNEVMLAYDKDYTTPEERKSKIEEYEKIASILRPYFQVSILIDFDNSLDYKDSPIDKGKEVFEDLIRNRLKR